MKEPTLADEFEGLFESEVRLGSSIHSWAWAWLWENRDRILAALRVAEIVQSVGTDDEGNPRATDIAVQSGEVNEYDAVSVCAAILDLAKNGVEK